MDADKRSPSSTVLPDGITPKPSSSRIKRERVIAQSNALLWKGMFRKDDGTWMDVAIKSVQKVSEDDREWKALASLDHDNIVKLYFVETDTVNVLRLYVLELCEASMDDYWGDPGKYRKQLTHPIDVLLQISEGLEFIHENKMTHRDIKPQNILFWPVNNKEGAKYVKVADFDLCKKVNTQGMHKPTPGYTGTFGWTPPEIINNYESGGSSQGLVGTTASDIFSSGLVFFFHLTKGKCHPFGTVKNIKDGNTQYFYELVDDQPAKKVIKEMIHHNPNDRPTASEVVKVLTKLKSDLDEQEKMSVSAQKFVERMEGTQELGGD